MLFRRKFISINSKKKSDSNDYFPEEEIMTLNQVHYLGIILFIYIIIINLLFETYSPVSGGLLFINNLIDICLSITIIVTFYDCSNKSRILSIFIMPMASIASLVFGGNLLGFWDFIRIPALLYVVIISYHEFLEFTNKNQLGKLILLLISIIFTALVLTIFFENQNPINSLSMVSNAFTSNGYAVLGSSVGGVLTSTFLVWAGYIISGVGTATLAAAIVQRNSKRKFKNLEEKIDNLERVIVQYHNEDKGDGDE